MNNSLENNPKKLHVTDALIIAVVPLLAYVFKYIYDYSYGKYFGIPPELVSFSLASVLPSLFFLSAFLLGALYYVATIVHYKEGMNYIQIVYQNVAVLILLAAWTRLVNNDEPYYLFFLVPAIYLVLRHFVLPLIWHYKENSYIEKSNKHFSKVRESADTPVDVLWNFGMYRQATGWIILVGLVFLTSIYGAYRAEKQTSFYILNTNHQNVAVRFLDDKVVFVTIDKNNKLTGQLYVRDVTRNNVVLMKKNIGPIKRP